MDTHVRPGKATQQPFEVIPVIDLMHGQVVHARRGDRAHYQPIRSALCANASVQDVIAGLLALYPFRTLYLADLDALRGGPAQWALIEQARQAFGHGSLWIDAGVRTARELAAVQVHGTAVLASETLDASAAARLPAAADGRGAGGTVLSLDYRDGEFLGEPGLFEHPERWPRRLIAMNLARVGGDLGPDLQRVRALRALAPHARVYASGGVRSGADLLECRRAGAAGVLVASSLHDRRIGRADLERLASDAAA